MFFDIIAYFGIWGKDTKKWFNRNPSGVFFYIKWQKYMEI